jgi:hypothetical protein
VTHRIGCAPPPHPPPNVLGPVRGTASMQNSQAHAIISPSLSIPSHSASSYSVSTSTRELLNVSTNYFYCSFRDDDQSSPAPPVTSISRRRVFAAASGACMLQPWPPRTRNTQWAATTGSGKELIYGEPSKYMIERMTSE